MIKIRGKCFETNSSSMDRYDDYDDGYSVGSVYGCTHGYQNIFIELEIKDDLTEEEEKQFDDIEPIENNLFDVINSYLEDAEDYEISSYGDEYIIISARINAVARITHPGDSGDRYCPPSGPDFEFEYDAMPLKNEEQNNSFKESIRKDLLNVFENAGWTGVTDIIRVYGDEVDHNELYDNLNY